ncbi:MAG: tryptophan-rich sensory protein [Verrucomicrobiae bacterium]|nr:tryptophan-rich sensory protein [Verrucomicrobiae bacterium]MDW8345073.1 TspO/MBR family protein [Verrucomicrobiae bacterium]
MPGWFPLVFFLAASYATSFVGGITTSLSVSDWYAALRKPTWTPPSWIFGPVWMFLYTAMAVAAWLVWRRVGWSTALWWWAAQLTLNALWSPVFFGLRRPDWALAVIVVLWVAIVITAATFWRIATTAGLLFMPYLAWVTFAAILNFTIWRLNADLVR